MQNTYVALSKAESTAAAAHGTIGLALLAVGKAAGLDLSHRLTLVFGSSLFGDCLFGDGKGLLGALAGLLKRGARNIWSASASWNG